MEYLGLYIWKMFTAFFRRPITIRDRFTSKKTTSIVGSLTITWHRRTYVIYYFWLNIAEVDMRYTINIDSVEGALWLATQTGYLLLFNSKHLVWICARKYSNLCRNKWVKTKETQARKICKYVHIVQWSKCRHFYKRALDQNESELVLKKFISLGDCSLASCEFLGLIKGRLARF